MSHWLGNQTSFIQKMFVQVQKLKKMGQNEQISASVLKAVKERPILVDC